MRKLMFLVALSIFGATQAKATACPTAATAASVYDASGFSCTIGTWTISNFQFSSTLSGSGAVPTDANLFITPLLGGGAGFMGSAAPGTWTSSSGIADVEIKYILSFTGTITSLYQSITGTVTPGPPAAGHDDITDTYCPGQTSQGNCSTQIFTDLYSNGTASNSVTFTGAPVSTVAVVKDVSANSETSLNGIGSTETVSSFVNCFNFNPSAPCSATPPPVAEPSALLMLGSGLLGLALLSVRRRRIV